MEAEIAEYIAQRKAEGLADTTLDNGGRILRRVAAALRKLGVRRVQDVKTTHIDEYIDSTKRAGLAYGTRLNLLFAARGMFRWLAEQGRILSDPTRHLILHSTREEPPLMEAPLSQEHVAELFASMPRRSAADLRRIAHLDLLYSAGLRLSESLALNTGDIDLSNRIIHVRKGKGRGGGKARDIPMMRGLQGALRDYLCLRRSLLRGPDHGALLLGTSGKRLSIASFGKYMSKLNRQRGPKKPHLHAHLFRHSIAVHLLRNGADIRYVQAFLGHESLDTTKEYLRLVPADIREAYEKAMPEIAVDASL